nr:hypothetical protein [Tanacetum cinerariifolium]
MDVDNLYRMARTQQLAVIHLVCLVVAYLAHKINTSDDIVTSPTPQSVSKLPTKSKSKKRKVDEEDPFWDKIANSLDNIVHALDRNSKVIENSRPHVYTEGGIYEELKCLGLERGDLHLAYLFLLENP